MIMKKIRTIQVIHYQTNRNVQKENRKWWEQIINPKYFPSSEGLEFSALKGPLRAQQKSIMSFQNTGDKEKNLKS